LALSPVTQNLYSPDTSFEELPAVGAELRF
jgi:hypothetical protein